MSKTLVTDSRLVAAFNRGPLTTAFIPPESCTQTLTMGQDRFDPNSYGLYFAHSFNSYVDLACYPTGTLQAQDLVSDNAWTTYYHSPAICPIDWTTAARFTSVVPGEPTDPQIPIGPDTTVALCCPRGYSSGSHIRGHICSSDMTKDQVVEYVYPTNNGQGYNRGSISYLTLSAPSAAIGDGIHIWYESSDSEVLAAASTKFPSTTAAPTQSMPAQTSPTTSIPPPTNPPGSNSTPSSGSFPTAAKIGLGVGIPLAVLIGLAAGFFLFRSRRKHSNTDGDGAHLENSAKKHAAEVYASTAALPPQEIDGGYYSEIHTYPEQHHSRHELPAKEARNREEN